MNIETDYSFDQLMEAEILNLEFENLESLSPLDVLSELYEIKEEYNEKLRKISLLELKKYNESGIKMLDEVSFNTSDLWSRFITAAETFFKKVIETLGKIWNWTIKEFDSIIASNNMFVTKYSKQLALLDTVELPFGYKFPGLRAPTVYKVDVPDKIGQKLTEDQFKSKKNVIVQTISNDIVLSHQENFKEALHRSYYGSPLKDDVYDIQEQLQYIKTCNLEKNNIAVIFKSAVAELKALSITLKMLSRFNSKEETAKIVQYVDLCKFNAECLIIAYGEYSKALIDRCKQAKAICIKALYDKAQELSSNDNNGETI